MLERPEAPVPLVDTGDLEGWHAGHDVRGSNRVREPHPTHRKNVDGDALPVW